MEIQRLGLPPAPIAAPRAQGSAPTAPLDQYAGPSGVSDKPAPPAVRLGHMCECSGCSGMAALQGGHCAPALAGLVAMGEGLKMDPQSVTHVLYHADCFDGFGAAYAAWKALGDSAEYIPVKYGQAIPDLPRDARVAIVDFSFPRKELLELKDKVDDLVVLDHHKTAVENLKGLDFARFDMDRAGAGLSWEFFHPGKPEPEVLQYVEDRDLWKFQLPASKEVSTALGSYPMDFETWDKLTAEGLRAEGIPLTRYKDQLVRQTVERAGVGEIAGYRVPVVNTPAELRSEVGHEMLQRNPDAPFVALYFIDEKGTQAWSLRSRGDFDVAALAGQFGGGGHKAAAGFARKPGEWIQPS